MSGLIESIAFDSPAAAADAYGGTRTGFTSDVYTCRADFIYQRGDEAVTAGKLTGTAVFKVKIRSCSAARAIDTSWRMRDVRRSVIYNIREIDAITDRFWIWLKVESGVPA